MSPDLAVLHIYANHNGFFASDEPITVGAARMLVLFGTDNGMRKEIDIPLRKKKIGAHIGELHGKILALHRHGEDAFQIIDWTFTP